MHASVGPIAKRSRVGVIVLGMSILATACSAPGEDPAVAAICSELGIRAPGRSGDIVVRERSGQNLAPAVAEAREQCPDSFPPDGTVVIVPLSGAREVINVCRIVVEASEGGVTTSDDLGELDDALRELDSTTARVISGALDDECLELPEDLGAVALLASTTVLCNAIDETVDPDLTALRRETSLDRLIDLVAQLPRATLDAAFTRCEVMQPDVETLIAALQDEIAAQAENEAADAERAEAERAAAARDAAEQAERDRRAQIDPTLLRCYDSYYSASYLSGQALRAATCIVDNLFFGGVTPTEANTSELMPEMLFHATWATWDSSTRLTYCSDIKRRGFDAAEFYGISLARTWRAQVRAAGSSWPLDDYDLVLDLLDTCESY